MTIFNTDFTEEAIHTQIDDVFKKEGLPLMETIKEEGIGNKAGISYFKDKRTYKPILALDALIFSRFGIRVKHVNSINSGYAILTAPPKKSGPISEASKKLKELRAIQKGLCPEEGCIEMKKRSKDVKDFEEELLQIAMETENSIKGIGKQIRGKGLVFNLRDARIDGLPADYIVYILVDFSALFSRFDVSPLEALAFLAHEIGHAYTHIELSYKQTKNNILVGEAIRRMAKRDIGLEDTFKIIATGLGSNVKPTPGAMEDNARVLIDIMFKSANNNVVENDILSASDSERVADQFAARLGFTIPLATGLHRLGKVRKREITVAKNIPLFIFTVIFSLLISPIFGLQFLLASIFFKGFIDTIVLSIVKGALGSVNVRETVYDEDGQRIQQLLNDIVRQIRLSDLPKDVLEAKIKEFDKVKNLMVLSSRLSLSDTISTSFADAMPWNAVVARETKDTRQLEKLIDNPLHVMTHKMRNNIK